MQKTLRLRSLFVMGVSTAAIAAATPALAQQATMLEELVVTAERRDQSLQDVPVAVTAFTSERPMPPACFSMVTAIGPRS